MSLPREQKKSQPPWLDLALFASVVAFLVYSVMALRSTRTPPPLNEKPKMEATELSPPEPIRQPASQIQTGPSSTETLRINCTGSAAKQTYVSAARLVQIQLSGCEKEKKSRTASWRASNRSSGEEILVFENPKENTISTNYFSLKEGLNEISLILDLGKGQVREEKLKIQHN